MPATVIEARGLGKRYDLGARMHGTLIEAITAKVRRSRRPAGEESELWALRDVNLDIAEGESVGLVGRNGAGKSTLLKLLARITEPSVGHATLNGRLGALLEVGTGFHPELTGRENVFLNGAILGMSRREIRSRFDEIVAFAGVERFLDTPVKRYSSGMYLRLAFSVAAHLEPEIVIVDEVLAVGDAEFQKKCFGRMGELGREGRTVVFVSHDSGAVARLCTRAVWLEDGRVRADGPALEILDAYHHSFGTEATDITLSRRGANGLDLLAVGIVDADGMPLTTPRRDEPFGVAVQVETTQPLAGLGVAVYLVNSSGVRVVDEDSNDGPAPIPHLPPGRHVIRMTVPPLLSSGEYTVGIWMGVGRLTLLDDRLLRFELRPAPGDLAEQIRRPRAVHPDVTWTVGQAP